MEEVLPALQPARRPQGNQVKVTTDVGRPGLLQRLAAVPSRLLRFYGEVVTEMKKVTWPEWPQVRQLAIGVILLSLFVGAVIAILDLIFQGIFVRGLPAILGS